MKLLKQGILIAALVGGLLVGLQPAAEASIDHVTLAGGCSSATLLVNYTRWSEGSHDERIGATISLGDMSGPTGPTLAEAVGDYLPTNPISGQVILTLNFPEQPMGTSFYILVLHTNGRGSEGVETVDREVLSYTCGGGSNNEGASNLPGCDVLMDIPEQAVAGQFVFNSEIYWAPGELVSPGLYVKAGNTYYVAGQDESETYYKVLISCQWVWVRKDTVRPNPDPIWNNTPLPTTIVE